MTLCIIQTSLDIVVVGDEVSEAKGGSANPYCQALVITVVGVSVKPRGVLGWGGL